jgi:dGTPase
LLYQEGDKERCLPYLPNLDGTVESYRTDFRRDYSRLIHSPVFRRLQGKTQLFPCIESDFFRNRLTHSLEVAQIGKSIAIKLNYEEKELSEEGIDTDLMETVCLAHDLGHPPFGHRGEVALDSCMKIYGGFEGNAQTLRILSKLEKKEIDEENNDVGLNFTYRTLASILKYDSEIPYDRENDPKVKKGYYTFESELVKTIKEKVAVDSNVENFKTVECYIMDIADDIAYSTYDLEDAFKAEFLNPLDMITADKSLLDSVAKEVTKEIRKKIGKDDFNFSSNDVLNEILEIFIEQEELVNLRELEKAKEGELIYQIGKLYQRSLEYSKDGYSRSRLTSNLVGRFINGVKFEFNTKCPALSKAYLDIDILKKVEVLKHFTYQTMIMSPRLKLAEYRGFEIVKTIFDHLIDDGGHLLLPDDFKEKYEKQDEIKDKYRIVCDYIAGMTDQYSIEFYGRLKSVNPQTIFKPF